MFYCAACAKDKNYPPTLTRSMGKCEICGAYRHCYDKPSAQLPVAKTRFVTPGLIATKLKEQLGEIAKRNMAIEVILVEYLGNKLPKYYHVTNMWDCHESPVGLCIYDEKEDHMNEHCIFCNQALLRDVPGVTRTQEEPPGKPPKPLFNGEEVKFRLPPKRIGNQRR